MRSYPQSYPDWDQAFIRPRPLLVTLTIGFPEKPGFAEIIDPEAKTHYQSAI